MFNVPVKKDNEITIATINVRTLKDDIKLGSTFEVFQSLRHDILCMQETRRLGEGIIDQNGSRFIWKGYKRKHEAGVGIIISQKAKLIDILYVSERILTIYIVINGICMSITNCYAPTDEIKPICPYQKGSNLLFLVT